MTILTEKPYPIPFFDLAPFTNPGFCFTLAINFELKFDFDMGDVYCSDCKKNTEVVFDHSAGDTVCSECGLVLESHSIDETSEWRTFANESGDNDPVRVGGPTNPLLSDGGLSTVISKPNGTTRISCRRLWIAGRIEGLILIGHLSLRLKRSPLCRIGTGYSLF